MRLAGKVAVITGAASGIGRTAARLFAEEGAAVLISDVAEEPGREAAAEIEKAGGRADFFKADVSRAAEVESLMRHAVETFGGLHVLYNNAGIMHPGDGGTAREVADGARVELCVLGQVAGGVVAMVSVEDVLEECLHDPYVGRDGPAAVG